MAASFTHIASRNPDAWRYGAAGLFLAATVVGIAIVAGGSAARALNGIGALIWIASGLILALTLPAPSRRSLGWIAAAAGGLILGGIVRPGTVSEAIVAFGAAGAIVVFAAGDRSGAWALLVPAIYLPVHLVIGIGRSMLRESGVRTDPPPTAAILPLAMIVAAGVAGWLVATAMRNRG